MKILVGLIGADDSVERIRSVAAEYPELALRSLVYWHEAEVVELVARHNKEIDLWLFSGQVPYAVAKQAGVLRGPAFWVPHTGSSLLGLLLYLSHEQHVRIPDISFDTFHPDELATVLNDLQIPAPPYLYHYPGAIDATQLADFHTKLWRNGQTKVAVTCLRSAHVELLNRGIPAYHVLPARSAIASTLEAIIRTHQLLRYRNAQIAVVLTQQPASAAAGESQQARWHHALQRWARIFSGVLQELPDGEWAIWTTRRFVEVVTNGFHTIPSLSPEDDSRRCWGIGLGQSVAQAQEHAQFARRQAEQHGPGSWFAVFDDKAVTGPMGQTTQLRFSYADRRLREASRRAGVSGTTLSKLQGVVALLGRDELSSLQLAEQLSILPRSARRLLALLEEAGLAEVVGEETPHPRGRPRKIYRIKLPVSD